MPGTQSGANPAEREEFEERSSSEQGFRESRTVYNQAAAASRGLLLPSPTPTPIQMNPAT